MPADPRCIFCEGTGQRYWHSRGCTSGLCALAGGVDDCEGDIEPCPCTRDVVSSRPMTTTQAAELLERITTQGDDDIPF